MKIEFLHQYHRHHRARCTTGSWRTCRVMRAPRPASRPLLNLRDRVPGLAKLSETVAGFAARRTLPKWRRDYFRAARARRRPRERGGRARGRAVRRHLQYLLRAREPACRRRRADGRRLHGPRGGGARRPRALLRPNVSRDGHDRRRARRSAAPARRARAVRRRGVADRRPRAVMHPRAARRAQAALPRRRRARRSRARPDVRGVPGAGARSRALVARRSGARPMRARSSTATAIRRRSARCPPSSRP